MYATEFQTVIKNSYIQVPDYKKFKNKSVRVIILDTEPENDSAIKNDFIERIVNKPRHISSDTNFLSREEANER